MISPLNGRDCVWFHHRNMILKQPENINLLSCLKPSSHARISLSIVVNFFPATYTCPFLLMMISFTSVHGVSSNFLHHFVRSPKNKYNVLPGFACPFRLFRMVCLLVPSRISGTNRSLNEYAGIVIMLRRLFVLSHVMAGRYTGHQATGRIPVRFATPVAVHHPV